MKSGSDQVKKFRIRLKNRGFFVVPENVEEDNVDDAVADAGHDVEQREEDGGQQEIPVHILNKAPRLPLIIPVEAKPGLALKNPPKKTPKNPPKKTH